MKLFWDETGPLVSWRRGILTIEDLNPQQEVKWRVRRWELIHLGFACIIAALFSR